MLFAALLSVRSIYLLGERYVYDEAANHSHVFEKVDKLSVKLGGEYSYVPFSKWRKLGRGYVGWMLVLNSPKIVHKDSYRDDP